MKYNLASFFLLFSIFSYGQSKIYYNLRCEITIPEMSSFYKIINIDTSTLTFQGIGKDFSLDNSLLREFYYNHEGKLDSLVMYESDTFLLSANQTYQGLRSIRYDKNRIKKKVVKETLSILDVCINRQENFHRSHYIRAREYPELTKILNPKSPYDTTAIFNIIEEDSQFSGGMQALGEFIGAFLKYPEQAIKNNITGIVKVKFTVDTNGIPKNFEIIEGIGHGCDKEALRVMKLMPDWIPGYQHGKAVETTKIIPISFN